MMWFVKVHYRYGYGKRMRGAQIVYVMRRRLFAVSLNDRKSLNVNGAMQLEVFASGFYYQRREIIYLNFCISYQYE